MTQTNFFDYVKEDIKDIESLMREQVNGYHPDINAALLTLLSSGGKRIRPTVVMLAGRMLGAPLDKLVIMGSALEMLHTATLVHDDLVDNALLRRGMPTLNSKWGPGATVLTGDFLFARAAFLAAQVESVPILQAFAKTLTVIVNGELTQFFSERFLISREQYFQRIYAKTASLFETSTQTAAMLSPIDQNQVEEMRQFGLEIGIAFQIIDDILDFTADPGVLGKPVGGDLHLGLVTLPTLYYIDLYPDDPDVKKLVDGNCEKNDKLLNRLVEAIRESDAIKLAHQEAKRCISKGIAYLEKQPQGIEKQLLVDLANYIVLREL